MRPYRKTSVKTATQTTKVTNDFEDLQLSKDILVDWSRED